MEVAALKLHQKEVTLILHISVPTQKKKNDCCQLVYFVEVEARIKEIEKNMYVFEDFT